MAHLPLASKLPPFTLLDEPLLAFSPEQPGDVDVHPLRGLSRYGPFSKGSFGAFTANVRVATVGPDSAFKQRGALLAALRNQLQPSDRTEYVPIYPGFEALFNVGLVSAPPATHIRWPDSLSQLDGQGTVKQRLYVAMDAALRRLEAMRNEFDVVVVHFPDAWGPATRGVAFDAHDALKALGAKYNIPTQVINDRAFNFRHRASLAWRLAIALYVKAGGIPWKLARVPSVPDETAYIGLAYALRGDQRHAHFVTCCSQVFDMDGGGMQFVAFEARDPVTDLEEARRNPYLSRDDMRAVLARSLTLYQDRNGGSLPKRLVIHKTTAFKAEELDGAFDALAGIPEVECIEIGARANWRGVWLIDSGRQVPPSKPSAYPVPRGTVVVRSGVSALLWVAGNAPDASTTGNYYQGKKSIPKPLLLTRHAGRGPLEVVAAEALALSKMDWNNDALYDPVPVSIRYSQRLARTIANVPDLPGKIYPYRLFM
ncbi:nuclease PIN [Alcaligenes faecalis]|uniref:argonaute/piwi family protein n=1 Tax=Alcaligenes faecalis TaxID=511 RepID=UPI00122C7581|nr:nuclease PIN [Alcaligenes faecalis]KAA1288960.1 nuclease PIN [Alcaligenes faecalis]MCM2558771.1 nuclease PIN [Alcaligenes faecalis]MCM2622637.1 nuclease PIN [Alcaligenes faecalis]MCR4142884.1 nuclease PIN [Alcaligenes faecalis]WHQ43806.1 nuclease PIN [Alcaligenes faecalis]